MSQRPDAPAGDAVVRTYRTLPSQLFGWLLVAGAVALATMLALGEHERRLDALTPIAVGTVVVAVVWVTLLRPSLTLRTDGVLLRNLLTDTDVPFEQLAEVSHVWAVELIDTSGRKHSSWAVPVRRDLRPKGNVDRYAESTTRGKAHQGIHAEVVAGHVRDTWQAWQRQGGTIRPEAPVSPRPSVAAVAPLAGAVLLAVLAFLV